MTCLCIQLFEKANTGNVSGGLVAEWCLSLKYNEMDKISLNEDSISFPVLAPPVNEEQYPFMALCCVETLLVFYPLFHYMIFRAIPDDDDDDDDVKVSCFHPATRVANFYPRTKTDFNTNRLNLCPDGYEILVAARNLDSDLKSSKYLLIDCSLPVNKTIQHGRCAIWFLVRRFYAAHSQSKYNQSLVTGFLSSGRIQ